MGNCLILYKSQYTKTNSAAREQRKAVVRVVKMADGKILEFAASILVKDLLVKCPGLGVGLSIKAPEYLPLSYELKLGNLYFLFPLSFKCQEGPPVARTEETPSVIKTIKVVITKKQLEDLVSKKISFDTVVSESKSDRTCFADSPRARGWRPELEAIPEGNEFGFSCNRKGNSLLLSL